MSFTGNYSCDSLKIGLLNGSFNFTSDTFYMALYTNEATLSATTTAYTTQGEATGGNYTPGGQLLVISQVPTTSAGSTVAYLSFQDASWLGVLSARGALIYKPGDNGAVCVLDFGSTKTSANVFTVRFPAPTNTSAILRVA